MRALVTGASGFIGAELLRRLESPAVLTRDAAKFARAHPTARAFAWRSSQDVPPSEAFSDVEVVFHLAGETVAQYWTRAAKRRISDSRALGTANLVRAIAALSGRPLTLISVSGNNYYGDRGDDLLPESAGPGAGFLSEVCLAWEKAAADAAAQGVRVVTLRLGLVLGRGGALKKMLPPFRFGLGGRLGSGQQWMSWIHIEDLVELLLFAARNQEMSGIYNAASPNPVRNRDFTRALAGALHRPAILPVPAFLLRTVMGEMSAMLLDSQRTSSAAVERLGFKFKHPGLEGALPAILKK